MSEKRYVIMYYINELECRGGGHFYTSFDTQEELLQFVKDLKQKNHRGLSIDGAFDTKDRDIDLHNLA